MDLYHILLSSEFNAAAQSLASDMLPNGKIQQCRFFIAGSEITYRYDPKLVTQTVIDSLTQELATPKCVPTEKERLAFREELHKGRRRTYVEKPLFMNHGLGEDGRGLVLCVRLATVNDSHVVDPRYRALLRVIKDNNLKIDMNKTITTNGMAASYADEDDFRVSVRPSNPLRLLRDDQIKVTVLKS